MEPCHSLGYKKALYKFPHHKKMHLILSLTTREINKTILHNDTLAEVL